MTPTPSQSAGKTQDGPAPAVQAEHTPAPYLARTFWRVVHDPEEIHQFCGNLAVLGGCGPSMKQPGRFWWNAKATPMRCRSETGYCDTVEEAKRNVEAWLESYLTTDRRDYATEHGLAQWWQKDGAWHIALPCPDPDPQTGYKTGGFRFTEDSYNTRDEAIAAIARATLTA